MSKIWDAKSFDSERRRLVPCFDQFYGSAVELVARSAPANPRILELGAGTGLLSSLLVERVKPGSLHLLDASAEMLSQAQSRLAAWQPTITVRELTAPLPAGPFDAVISALAIHHLPDAEKQDLFARIYEVLAAGGVFVNAEQILGETEWQQQLYESVHLDTARLLGSPETEIAEANQRMRYDRCAPLATQVEWLKRVGYVNAGIFFQWFRFAVYAGWKAGFSASSDTG